MRKCHGGLGLEDLEIKNECLLTKWLFKLLTEEGVWKSGISVLLSKWLFKLLTKKDVW